MSPAKRSSPRVLVRRACRLFAFGVGMMLLGAALNLVAAGLIIAHKLGWM